MIVALSDIGQEPKPLIWSNERYLALVESGVIDESRYIELIDGQVVVSMPQGKLYNLIFLALQKAFAALELFEHGLAVQTTVMLREGNTYDPEFALLRPEYIRANFREVTTYYGRSRCRSAVVSSILMRRSRDMRRQVWQPIGSWTPSIGTSGSLPIRSEETIVRARSFRRATR